MVEQEVRRVVDVCKCKTGTTDSIRTAGTLGEPTYESSFAAAEVTDELDHFVTAQFRADLLGEP